MTVYDGKALEQVLAAAKFRPLTTAEIKLVLDMLSALNDQRVRFARALDRAHALSEEWEESADPAAKRMGELLGDVLETVEDRARLRLVK